MTLMPILLHDEKNSVARHLNSFEVSISVVPLLTLLALCNLVGNMIYQLVRPPTRLHSSHYSEHKILPEQCVWQIK